MFARCSYGCGRLSRYDTCPDCMMNNHHVQVRPDRLGSIWSTQPILANLLEPIFYYTGERINVPQPPLLYGIRLSDGTAIDSSVRRCFASQIRFGGPFNVEFRELSDGRVGVFVIRDIAANAELKVDLRGFQIQI